METCRVCYPETKCTIEWKGCGYRLLTSHNQPPVTRDEFCEVKELAKLCEPRVMDIEDRLNDLLLGS